MLNRTIAPVAQPLIKRNFPEVRELQLENGVSFYSIPFGDQELIEIQAVFYAGKGFEKKPGVASLTTQMLQEGTQKYSSFELAKALDDIGAILSIESGYESVTASLTVLPKHLKAGLALLEESVFKPAFPEDELAKLKLRMVQRLEVQEQKTGYVARKRFNNLLFSDEHPYGRVVGKAEVEAIEINDLRAFHQEMYTSANMFVVASGNYEEAELVSELEQSLGKYEGGESKEELSGANGTSLRPLTGYKYYEMPDSMQATIRIGHEAFLRSHPDHHAMQVVITILGGYFGSRLMKNIREEKGYTYGIGAAWLSMKYNGLMIIQTDVANEYVVDTLSEIKKEIDQLLKIGVEEEELLLVKNYMLGRLISSRETPGQVAATVSGCVVNDIPFNDLDEKFDLIQKVTTNDIHRLANQYIKPESMLEVVVGNLPDQEL